MRLPVLLFAIIGTFAVAVPVSACWTAFQTIEIDKWCRLRAHGGPGINLCIREEQGAYDSVKSIWNRFDPDLTAKCVQPIRGPYQSYVGMLNCLDEAAAPIQESRGRAHFHY